MSIFYWTVIGQSKSNFGEISRAFVNTISYGLAGGILVAFVGLAVAILVVRYQKQVLRSELRKLF